MKKFPELAWGFKSNFYKMMIDCEPHQGYYTLLDFVKNKLKDNYFICTSNIDNYFEDYNFVIKGNLYIRYDVNLAVVGSTNNLMVKYI